MPFAGTGRIWGNYNLCLCSFRPASLQVMKGFRISCLIASSPLSCVIASPSFTHASLRAFSFFLRHHEQSEVIFTLKVPFKDCFTLPISIGIVRNDTSNLFRTPRNDCCIFWGTPRKDTCKFIPERHFLFFAITL
jgi:hypothetical protein